MIDDTPDAGSKTETVASCPLVCATIISSDG